MSEHREDAGPAPAQDAELPEDTGEASDPDDAPDPSGLPKSLIARAALALFAVFWIVVVIMLFLQGAR